MQDQLNAMFQDILKRRLAEHKWIQNWQKALDKATEAGNLEMMAQWLRNIVLSTGSVAEDLEDFFREKVYKPLGLDIPGETDEDALTRPEGIKGAIKGITEDTAGLLAGQFNAIRMNTVELVGHFQSSNMSLAEMTGSMENLLSINTRIADNTSVNPAMLAELQDIKLRLDQDLVTERDYLRATG